MSDFNPLAAYDTGLQGCIRDPRADEMCADSIIRHGGNPNGGEIAHEWEFADAGKGKLVTMWEHVMRTWPNCWPGPPQDWGDCVGWGVTRAALMSWTCELLDGKPDEVSGIVEGKPDLTKEAIENCVVSCEATFWWRGRSGDGWSCSSAAQAITTDSGVWLRQPYPEFKFDLTKYSLKNSQLYGARPPSDPIRDAGREHLVRTATFLKGCEQIRDFLYAGYGVFFCSGLSWSDKRDENGFSPTTRGGWAHSQAACGWDDRPETIKIYGEPLCCIINSWSKWNSGPRKVLGTNLEIPHGAYWVKASDMDRCQCIALSSVAGWPARKLKSYGAVGNI
jgi:hypothetical protein